MDKCWLRSVIVSDGYLKSLRRKFFCLERLINIFIKLSKIRKNEEIFLVINIYKLNELKSKHGTKSHSL